NTHGRYHARGFCAQNFRRLAGADGGLCLENRARVADRLFGSGKLRGGGKLFRVDLPRAGKVFLGKSKCGFCLRKRRRSIRRCLYRRNRIARADRLADAHRYGGDYTIARQRDSDEGIRVRRDGSVCRNGGMKRLPLSGRDLNERRRISLGRRGKAERDDEGKSRKPHGGAPGINGAIPSRDRKAMVSLHSIDFKSSRSLSRDVRLVRSRT